MSAKLVMGEVIHNQLPTEAVLIFPLRREEWRELATNTVYTSTKKTVTPMVSNAQICPLLPSIISLAYNIFTVLFTQTTAHRTRKGSVASLSRIPHLYDSTLNRHDDALSRLEANADRHDQALSRLEANVNRHDHAIAQLLFVTTRNSESINRMEDAITNLTNTVANNNTRMADRLDTVVEQSAAERETFIAEIRVPLALS